MNLKFLIPAALETPRLQLRMFVEADWDSLHKMFCNENCVRYTMKTPLAKWQTWRTMASYLGHWHLRGFGPYAVVEKSSGNMIGPVGLWYPGEWPEPEIKWSLSEEYWGKGYATEAASAVKGLAAQELKWKRLISLILPDNVSSKAVAQRIGGKYERTIPFRDETAEVYLYDLLE
jgi:RimJ/RimL family protein N-acetyltransferase